MRRRWSINTLLLAGMGGLLFGGVLVSTMVSEQVLSEANGRRDLLIYYSQIHGHSQDQLLAMVNQEVGLAGYLATGDRRFLEPYARGKEEQRAAATSLDIKLRTEDRALLGDSIESFQRAGAEWQVAFADPNLAGREDGPLANLPQVLVDGKNRFDRIRAAHVKLADNIRLAADTVVGGANFRIQRARWIGHGVTALLMLLGVSLIRLLLRHTAKPLIELERKASAHEPFPAASPDVRVREVALLQHALHDLDRTGRARESERVRAASSASAFNAFGKYAQEQVDENELQASLGRAIDDTFAPDETQILVHNAARHRLERSFPEPIPSEEVGLHPILAEPMRCRAVRTQSIVNVDADSPTACFCSLGVPKQGSYCCMPMFAATGLVGVVNLKSNDKGHFNRERVEVGRGYVAVASTALSSIRLLASTRERALRDSLTGAYNRVFLSEYLSKQISLVSRGKRPLAVLVCDLDHFKQVNDRHGHQVGDRALVAFSALLHHSVRNGDAVVRFGGEEFVVVLVETDLVGARTVAERIRSGAENINVSNGSEAVGAIVRTSIGIATYPNHGVDEASLIGAADRALYQAKREGRNRVVVASAPTTTDTPVLRLAER
jgi:diguanylate cyclase (GGDEF)-like protein